MIKVIKDKLENKKVKISKHAFYDKIFNKFISLNAFVLVALLMMIFATILYSSWDSVKAFGFGFIYSQEWDPIGEIYGALPFIMGTLISSVLALIISIPFSLAIALYLGEYSSRGILPKFIRSMIELMAAIPSVIYGFWGLAFLVPVIREFQMSMDILPYGVGILAASLILAIMIIPYSSSVAREVIAMVPRDLKEVAYSLGSTRFEVISKVVIPYAKSGIIAGILLSFGRAIGETMAVTMLIGNSNKIPESIFDTANTMASIIANEFAEAAEGVPMSALFEIALVLFLISVSISLIGRLVIRKMEKI